MRKLCAMTLLDSSCLQYEWDVVPAGEVGWCTDGVSGALANFKGIGKVDNEGMRGGSCGAEG